jgi:uncharacterized protein YlxW (UPF0749 family)
MERDQIARITQEAITQHAQVCAVKMDTIEKNVERLTAEISKLATTVDALKTQVTILDQRWRVFTVVAGVVGVIGTIAGIIGVIVALM